MITNIESTRAIESEKIIEEVKKNKKIYYYFSEIEDSYEFLKTLKPPYLITGSLYLVGKILEIEGWKRKKGFY